MTCQPHCAVCNGFSCTLCHEGYHIYEITPETSEEKLYGCGKELGGIPYCLELNINWCIRCAYPYVVQDGECALQCDENTIINCDFCEMDRCLSCHNGYLPDNEGLQCFEHDNSIDHCVVAEGSRCVECQYRYAPYKGRCVEYQCGIDDCVMCRNNGVCVACGDGMELLGNRCLRTDMCGIEYCLECTEFPRAMCHFCLNGAEPLPENNYKCVLRCNDHVIDKCIICEYDRCLKCDTGYDLSEDHMQCVPIAKLCQIPGCTECLNTTTCTTCDAAASLIPNHDASQCILLSKACVCGSGSGFVCIEHCQFCVEIGKCLICDDGYYAWGAECIKDCPPDTRKAARSLYLDGKGLFKLAKCSKCLSDSLGTSISNCMVCNYNGIGCAKCKSGYHGTSCVATSLREVICIWVFTIFLLLTGIFELSLLLRNRQRRRAKVVNID